jgi:hypothetical protein
MTKAQTRAASYDEIIADPLFKAGYAEVWDGIDPAADLGWSDAEQLAYERGRQFGVVVRQQEGSRVPLVRGYLAHPRAKILLMMAMRDGDVL